MELNELKIAHSDKARRINGLFQQWQGLKQIIDQESEELGKMEGAIYQKEKEQVDSESELESGKKSKK